MKRARVLLVLVVALWLTVGVAATARSSPCSAVSGEVPCYLTRGERAPYSGELWPSAFALAVLEDRAAGERLRGEAAKARADLEAEQKLRAIDRIEAEAVLAAERAAHAKTRELARALVEPPSWFERPSFTIPATFVGTVILGGVVVYLLR